MWKSASRDLGRKTQQQQANMKLHEKTKYSQSIVLPRGEKLGKVCACVFMPEEASCNTQRTEFEFVHVQRHLQLYTSLLFLQDKGKS